MCSAKTISQSLVRASKFQVRVTFRKSTKHYSRSQTDGIPAEAAQSLRRRLVWPSAAVLLFQINRL